VSGHGPALMSHARMHARHAHSYLILNGIVYLTIADKSYPRKLAFSYLDELSKEFERSYAGLSCRAHCVPNGYMPDP
jgi:hypothetical protein